MPQTLLERVTAFAKEKRVPTLDDLIRVFTGYEISQQGAFVDQNATREATAKEQIEPLKLQMNGAIHELGRRIASITPDQLPIIQAEYNNRVTLVQAQIARDQAVIDDMNKARFELSRWQEAEQQIGRLNLELPLSDAVVQALSLLGSTIEEKPVHPVVSGDENKLSVASFARLGINLPDGVPVQILVRSLKAHTDDPLTYLQKMKTGEVKREDLVGHGGPRGPLQKLWDSLHPTQPQRNTSFIQAATNAVAESTTRNDPMPIPGTPGHVVIEHKRRNSSLVKPADAKTIPVRDIFLAKGLNLNNVGHHAAVLYAIKESGIRAGVVTDHQTIQDALDLLTNGDSELGEALIANAPGEKSAVIIRSILAEVNKNKQVAHPEDPVAPNPPPQPQQTETGYATDFGKRRENHPFPALAALLTIDGQRFKIDGRHSLTRRFMEIQGKKPTVRPRGEQGSTRQKADREEAESTTALAHELNALDQIGTKYATIDAMLKQESARIPLDLQRQIRWAQLADLPPAALRHLNILIADKSVRPTSPSELKRAILKRLHKKP